MIGEIIGSCLLIFFCRILDVSLGTIKTVLTIKEKTKIAAVVGFCEVFVWYLVVKDALVSDAPVLLIAVSYAGGYAMGTFVGGIIAKQFISGRVTMQVITSSRDHKVVEGLREFGHGVSVVNVNEGYTDRERLMLFSTIDKRKKKLFEEQVHKLDPGAFIVVQNTQEMHGGYDKAKVLQDIDYNEAWRVYLKVKKEHLIVNDQRLANHFAEKFNISFSEGISTIYHLRKDYIKCKKAGNIPEKIVPEKAEKQSAKEETKA